MYPCPNCGRPWVVCGGRCRSRNEDLENYIKENDEKVDVSFQCYAVPKMIYIFNGEDPNRWEKLVGLVNEQLRIIRDIYWDFEEEAQTTDDENIVVNKSNTIALQHVAWHVDAIHQLLAPSFVNNDIDMKNYNNFIDEMENWLKWLKKVSTTGNFTFSINEFLTHMEIFYKSIEACFPHIKKEKQDEAFEKEKLKLESLKK